MVLQLIFPTMVLHTLMFEQTQLATTILVQFISISTTGPTIEPKTSNRGHLQEISVLTTLYGVTKLVNRILLLLHHFWEFSAGEMLESPRRFISPSCDARVEQEVDVQGTHYLCIIYG